MANYYKLLGVPKDASDEDIKKAFREKAIQNHPDKINHLSEEEKLKRQELMYQINEAYGTLSSAEKRKVYDKQSSERQSSNTRSSEGANRQTRRSETSYDDLFSSIFSNSGMDSIFGGGGSWGDFFGTPLKQDDFFSIPENDWGLIIALKKAYESKGDGKWRVKKSESDKREWMPDELYSVKKENGKITVFRKINDWRSEFNRDKIIEIRKEGSYTEKEQVKPDVFINEYYLAGDGRDRMSESYKIPSSFGEYLGALKSLAKKFAKKELDKDGKYEISQEVRIMNSYGEYGANNTRCEWKSLWKDDKNREWVKKVDFDDFWEKMRESEKTVIQIEGVQKSKEGQRPPTNMSSGESKA